MVHEYVKVLAGITLAVGKSPIFPFVLDLALKHTIQLRTCMNFSPNEVIC